MSNSEANHERIYAARDAIDAYARVKDLLEECPEEALTDLLTDLRHYAAANQIDFEKALRLSENHYQEEKI